MSSFSTSNVTIRGIAAAVPTKRENNSDYELLKPKERELFIKTTGISGRRIARESQTTSDLCFNAAERLLAETSTDGSEIGLLVFVSQSGDFYLPATAAILQNRLKLPVSTIAFDVGLGCSGYVYGLAITASLMQTTGKKKALLLAGDVSSATAAREDKSTYPIFGDAGSATLLETTPAPSIWHFNLMTDGSGAEAIIIPDGGLRNKITPESFKPQIISEGVKRSRTNLVLNGPEIFSFATREVPTSIGSLASESGQDINEISHFIMHQANRILNETIRKKLGIPLEKTPYSLDEFGNTSSASIPLTIVTRIGNELKNEASKLLLSGFGVGLSWGNAFIDIPPIHCVPLIEVP